jgi:hypothetical protein
VPSGRKIRYNIPRVSRDRNRAAKRSCLPAALFFVREGHACKPRTIAGPQVAYVRAGILRSLIKTHTRYLAGILRGKLYPELLALTVVISNRSRHVFCCPQAIRTSTSLHPGERAGANYYKSGVREDRLFTTFTLVLPGRFDLPEGDTFRGMTDFLNFLFFILLN